jgi:hypothetical protein
MLCCLLFLFAVEAKIAPYHPHLPEAKSIAATKAWQDNAIPSVESGPVSQAPALLDIFAVLLILVFTAIRCVSLDEPVVPAPSWFSPYLSIRPPPAR